MARKLTLADLDFSNPDNNPDWADAIRKESEEAMRQREERRSRPSFNNIVSEVDSTAISPGAFANTVSGSVSSTERQSLEERFTLPNLAAAGVEAIADFVTTPYTEALGDKMGANVDRIVAGGAVTVGDASVINPMQIGSDIMRNVSSNPLGAPGAALEAILRQVPAAAKTATGFTQEEGLEIAKQRTASGEARDARADAVIAEMTEGRSTPYKWLVEGTADVAGSGSSFLSVFGGPTAAITYGDIYLQEYGAARAAGLSPDQAADAANGQAVVETSLSILPSGRIGKRLAESIPGVKQGIEAIENRLVDGIETVAGKALYTGVEAAKAATGESVQEMAASTGQDIVRRFQGLVGEEKAREYAQQNVVALEDYPEMLRRSGVAGFMMGGGIRTPTATYEANLLSNAIQTERTADLEAATVGRMQEFNNFVEGSNARTQEREAKAETELDLDIAREEERIRNEEARTAAFEQAEAERAEAERRAAEQKELEEEAGFQTIERDADLPRDRVERYADVVERVPVNPAQEITPEQVQEQRRRETREQVEQQQRSEQGQRIEFLRKRQEAAAAREQKAANAEQEKRAKEARTRERKIADEIIAANPNATAAELETAFQARLMQPDPKPQPKQRAKKEATTTPDAQQVPAPQPAPQAAPTQTSESAQQEAPARPAPTEVPPPPPIVTSDRELTDEYIQRLSEYAEAKATLGMSANSDAAPPTEGRTAPLTGGRIAPTVDMEAYKAKVKPLIRNLVKRTSKDSRSFQKLVLQDKLRIVPNASTVGFKEQGRVAEYDANEGKLYLYTDALEANGDVVPAIARAFHEATHAGQFNDREGRSNLYRHFLGDKKTSEAAKKIRKAAAQGNRLASDALADAQRDTAARQGDSQYEDLELVAYFTNRVVERRGSALGSVGGVVRDLTTAARQWLRDGVGLDLEVSLGDLQTAAANVGSEIADTDVRGLRGRDRLGMEDDVRQQNLRAVRAEENITRDLTRGVDGTAYRDLVDRARQLVTAVAGNPAFSELSAYDRAVRTADALENLREVINDRNTPLGRTLQEVRDAARQQAEEAFTARVIEEADNTIDRTIAALEQDDVSEFEQRRTARDLAEVNSSDDLVDTLDRILSRRQGTRLGMTADEAVEANRQEILNTNVPSNEDIRLGMSRVDAESGDFAATDTPEFRRWFGNSTVVDRRGNPRIMYHGTKDAFNTFRVNDLGLIFASPSETFAEAYAGINEFTLEHNNPIPLYVRAENTWDYENPEHRALLLNNEASMNSLRDYFSFLTREDSANMSAEELDAFIASKMAMGDWDLIEQAANVEAIKAAGFDSLNVFEGNAKNIAVFEPNQFKHATENKGAWSLDNDNMFGMAAPTSQDTSTRFRNRGGKATAIISALRNDKGLGPKVRDAVELATPYVAEMEGRMNQYMGEYQKQLSRVAAQRGTTYDALNKEISNKLDAIRDAKGAPSEVKAAYAKVASEYGEAGQALLKARALNDDLSRVIINTYLSRGDDLTKKEAKELAAVAANLGRYTHRFYASRISGAVGQRYRDNVWKAIEKHKEGKKKLTPKEQEVYDTYSKAAKVLLEDLAIPTSDGLYELSADRIDYLYGTWVVNKDIGASLDEKIAALDDVRDRIGEKDMNAQLEITSKALLYPFDDSSPVSVFYNSGAKRDNTIMKQRKHLPKEIRDFMGEVVDPMGVLLVTASKQAEWVARTKMFLELQREADPADLQPPGSAREDITRANNMNELKGEEFGPLEGWYASPAMRAMIDSTRESLMTLTDAVTVGDKGDIANPILRNAHKLWVMGARTTKFTSIVGNFARWAYTAAGSLAMPTFNGNFSPTAYASGMRDAGALVRYAWNPTNGLGSAARAVRNKVVDSSTIGDLSNIDRSTLEKIVNDMSQASPSRIRSTIFKYVKSGGLALREAYAMLDVWAKIANFHNEVDYLTKLYKDAGIEKTANEIDREASTIVNNTNIGWTRTAPFIKSLERGGITMFGPYLYDTFRIQFTNLAQAVTDLERSQSLPTLKARNRARARSMSRIGGQIAYYTAATYISKALAGMFGEDEDLKRDVGLYDGMRNEDYINVGMGEDGKARLFRFSDFDAIGPALNIMRTIRAGGDVGDVAEELMGLYIAPTLAGYTATAVAQSITNAPEDDRSNVGYIKDPLLEEWFGEVFYGRMLDKAREFGISENTVRAWNNVGENTITPGFMRAWTSRNMTPLTPVSEGTFDTAATHVYSAMRFIGARATTYDPKIGGKEAREAYVNTLNNNRRGMADYISRTKDPTPEEFLKKATMYIAEEKQAWDKVERMYEGMLALGMEDDEIKAALMEGLPSMNKSVYNQVVEGEFRSELFKDESFDKRAENAIKRAKTEREKEELAERWEAAKEILELYEGEY